MSTYSTDSSKNQNHSEVKRHKGQGASSKDFQFEDNRPIATQLKKIQESANNSHSSKELQTIQRVCYSMTGRDQSGNDSPGSDFGKTIKDSHYVTGDQDIQVTSNKTAKDDESGKLLSKAECLSPITANIDHIVPANLGGGGVVANSRVLNASDNSSRQDDFNAKNKKHSIKDVVIVHGQNEYTSKEEAMEDMVKGKDIETLKDKWRDPWRKGNLTDKKPDSDKSDDEDEDE